LFQNSDFVDSNSQAFSFSRRNASEVCQSLANRARGWSGGRRQDACEAPLEAGLIDPPRAARHRARPRQGAAPPSAPPATRPSTVPGRPGLVSFRSVCCRIASRKRPLIGQDASRISEVLGTGIRNTKKFIYLHLQSMCPGRSAARSTCEAVRCRATSAFTRVFDAIWSRLLATRRNRGPGSAKQRFARATRCIAPGTRTLTRPCGAKSRSQPRSWCGCTPCRGGDSAASHCRRGKCPSAGCNA
jgi:hypothetical protein